MSKKQIYPFTDKKEGSLTEKELLNLETETIEFNEIGLPINHSLYKSYNSTPTQFFTYDYEYDDKGNWIKLLIKSTTERYKDVEHRRVSREIKYYD